MELVRRSALLQKCFAKLRSCDLISYIQHLTNCLVLNLTFSTQTAAFPDGTVWLASTESHRVLSQNSYHLQWHNSKPLSWLAGTTTLAWSVEPQQPHRAPGCFPQSMRILMLSLWGKAELDKIINNSGTGLSPIILNSRSLNRYQ